MLPLSPETLARVEALFLPEQRAAARALLEIECATNLPFCERSDMFAMERIRFAVLKVSAGDLNRLQRAIEQAQLDWRDTLMAAEFGRDVTAHLRWFPDTRG